MTADVGGKPRDVDGGEIRVPCRGHVGEEGRAFPSRRAEDPAVTAGGDVATRTRVGLLDVPRREHLLIRHEQDAPWVAPSLFAQHARYSVLDQRDEVLRA